MSSRKSVDFVLGPSVAPRTPPNRILKSILKRKCNDLETESSSKRSRIEDSEVEACSFADLPIEVIGRILESVSFDDLLVLELVCKRIRSTVLDLVWPKKDTLSHESIIQFTNYRRLSLEEARGGSYMDTELHRITARSMKKVCSRTNIRRLDLSIYWTTISDNIWGLHPKVPPLFSMMPQLTSLNLSLIILTKDDLDTIASRFPLLEEVSFDQSLKTSDTEQGLQKIFCSCPNIKYLNLATNLLLTGACFEFVPASLRYLNIGKCRLINEEGLDHLSQKATNLETLIWQNLYPMLDFNLWINEFTKLRFVELSMGENCMFLDFSKLPELEMLSLHDDTLAPMETLQTLKNCPKLKSLAFSTFEKLDILEALKDCKSLKFCDFRSCYSLKNIVEFVNHAKLQYLSIDDLSDIYDEEVRHLLTQCVSLTHLELDFRHSDSHKVVAAVLTEPCPQRETALKLAVQRPKYPLPPCDWCEYHAMTFTKNSNSLRVSVVNAFPHFTDPKIQYRKSC